MAAIAVDDRSTREGSAWVGWTPLALAPIGVVMFQRGMWLLAIAIYASLKWASWALAKTALGVVVGGDLRCGRRRLHDRPGHWMVLIAHFGSFHVVSLVWRSFGVDAAPIMASPASSQSLSEFWGRR
jgi:hypothetical protein